MGGVPEIFLIVIAVVGLAFVVGFLTRPRGRDPRR